MNDPGVFAARKMELMDKRQALDGAWKEAIQQRDNTRSEERTRFITQERDKLMSQVEGWGQDKLNQAFEVFKGQGFEDKDMEKLVGASPD